MLSSKEIIGKRKELHSNLCKIKNEINDKENEVKNLFKNDKNEWGKKHKLIHNDIDKLNYEKINLELSLKVWENNLKIASFNEVMPKVLEVLNKYFNKPYGDKTRQKITKEVESLTGARLYINADSYIVYVNDVNFDCGFRDNKRMLINNKIQRVEFSEMRLLYLKNTYIEDVNSYVTELRKMHDKLYKLQQKFLDEISKYNDFLVGNIECIDRYTTIYKDF